ncbi:hypothetical protein [Thiogranum longum]|jgi:hypothetical protein
MTIIPTLIFTGFCSGGEVKGWSAALATEKKHSKITSQIVLICFVASFRSANYTHPTRNAGSGNDGTSAASAQAQAALTRRFRPDLLARHSD